MFLTALKLLGVFALASASPRCHKRTVTARVPWFTVFFTLLGATAWMPSLYIKRAGPPRPSAC